MRLFRSVAGPKTATLYSALAAITAAAATAAVFVAVTDPTSTSSQAQGSETGPGLISASARVSAADNALTLTPATGGGFRLCNNTGNRVGVAIGYKDMEGWATEGWWNLPEDSCETLLSGPLISRYYYVYAVDYDEGGEWTGANFMCTRDKVFTIRGVEDCLTRGYERTGFFEIDTGEQTSWTVQLTSSQQGVGGL